MTQERSSSRNSEGSYKGLLERDVVTKNAPYLRVYLPKKYLDFFDKLVATATAAPTVTHVDGRWCEDLKCSKCYASDTWQKAVAKTETATITHTGHYSPGPWRVDPDDRPGMDWNRHVYAADGLAVCFMAHSAGKNRQRDEANANLVAAAPAVLAALEKALHESGCDGDLCMHHWHEEARKAIRLAKEGE